MIFLGLEWRDCVEIVIISYGFYLFFSWLSADKQSKLMVYCYRYAIVGVACYFLSLTTLGLLLTLGFPLWVVVLSFFHQSSLQRNFVTAQMQKKMSASAPSHHWHNELIRTLAHHKTNRPATFLLEQTEDLSYLLMPGIACSAPVSHALLSLIIASEKFDPHALVRIAKDGTIREINSRWRLMGSITWSDAALVYTAKTDAIIVHSTTDSIVTIRNGMVEEAVTLATLPQFFTNLSGHAPSYARNRA